MVQVFLRVSSVPKTYLKVNKKGSVLSISFLSSSIHKSNRNYLTNCGKDKKELKRVIDFYLYSSISFFAAASKKTFKVFVSLSALHHPNKQKCTKYWRIKSLGDKTSYFISYSLFYVKHELQQAKLSTMPIGIPKEFFYMSDHLMPSENSNQHSWKIVFVTALFDGKFVGGSQYPQNVLLKQFPHLSTAVARRKKILSTLSFTNIFV